MVGTRMLTRPMLRLVASLVHWMPVILRILSRRFLQRALGSGIASHLGHSELKCPKTTDLEEKMTAFIRDFVCNKSRARGTEGRMRA